MTTRMTRATAWRTRTSRRTGGRSSVRWLSSRSLTSEHKAGLRQTVADEEACVQMYDTFQLLPAKIQAILLRSLLSLQPQRESPPLSGGGDFVATVEKAGMSDKVKYLYISLKEETLHNICRIGYELDKWVSFSLCGGAQVPELRVVACLCRPACFLALSG